MSYYSGTCLWYELLQWDLSSMRYIQWDLSSMSYYSGTCLVCVITVGPV